jgi:uncharacterized membrane protein YjfL (UPF0719 family)
MDMINMQYVVNSLIFSALGVIILAIAFFFFEVITPQYKIWKEIIEKQNTALAILLGAFAIGISLIIASAIHG